MTTLVIFIILILTFRLVIGSSSTVRLTMAATSSRWGTARSRLIFVVTILRAAWLAGCGYWIYRLVQSGIPWSAPMTILDYVLVGFMFLQIWILWDFFKQKEVAERDAQKWFTLWDEQHKKNEGKDAEIIRLNEKLTQTEGELSSENRILLYKHSQCSYLCNLLEQRGIEWETGWRKLSERESTI